MSCYSTLQRLFTIRCTCFNQLDCHENSTFVKPFTLPQKESFLTANYLAYFYLGLVIVIVLFISVR